MNDLWWMAWNLFLGVIPFVLSLFLFRKKAKLTILWLAGFGVYFLFLPNAPYVLTDIMHLYTASLAARSMTLLMMLVLQYCLFVLLGAWLFCFSYKQLELFLERRFAFSVHLIQIVVFVLMSIGVYLGRFLRFNTWSVVTHPMELVKSVEFLINLHAFIYISFFTLLLFLIYLFYEQFNLHPSKKRYKV